MLFLRFELLKEIEEACMDGPLACSGALFLDVHDCSCLSSQGTQNKYTYSALGGAPAPPQIPPSTLGGSCAPRMSPHLMSASGPPILVEVRVRPPRKLYVYIFWVPIFA